MNKSEIRNQIGLLESILRVRASEAKERVHGKSIEQHCIGYAQADGFEQAAAMLVALVEKIDLEDHLETFDIDAILDEDPDLDADDYDESEDLARACEAAKYAADAKRFGATDGYRYLTIRDGELVLDISTGDEIHKIVDLRQLDGVGCACSSSIDFPTEYTTDDHVIQMCAALRGC